MLALAVLLVAAMAATAAHASGKAVALEADCEGGDGQACATLGGWFMEGLGGVSADPARARALFERGCALDNTAACVDFYIAVSLGQGGPRDARRARELAPRACTTGLIPFEVRLQVNGLCRERR